MKIDDEIESAGAEPAGQPEIVAEARETTRPLDDDDVVEVGMVAHHRLGWSLDEIGEARAREAPLQGADGRRREHDVADQPQADEQDVVGRFYGSIFASSMSITGMSSLIGYTR